MRIFKSSKIAILLVLALLISNVLSAAGAFVITSNGVRYVIKNAQGQIQKVLTPEYDTSKGSYFVRDASNQIIARQSLLQEAAMEQFKIVVPVDSGVTESKDFLGNRLPVLRTLESSDPRYQQLKSYIESNPGIKQTVAMQVEARNYKMEQLQQAVSNGTKDSALAEWLVSDLKKPVYLEINDSGYIYHDSSGFILAEPDSAGNYSIRDNSNVNRLAVADNSEVFTGGMKDPSAASVISHEIAHMIMDQLYETPNYPATSYYGSHSKNSVTDEGFAISEGWAEAIEALSTKEYRANNDTSDSWRLVTQDNIENNKYIFKNQGVTQGPNDGILKSGSEMLSTEGVNASLFYDLLSSKDIQNPSLKIYQVFENSKPQTYREFVYDYIEMFPEDRSVMLDSFLETTKYATVDTNAQYRYKDLHDSYQSYLNATDSAEKANLKRIYDAKLKEYEAYNDKLYKQAVVEGTIDSALDGKNVTGYKTVKLSEIILKSQKAFGLGARQAADSLQQSFSAKNMAITAGTSIAINLASQLMNGEKPSFKDATKAVFSMRFAGNFVGSSLGAAAGQLVVPLIQTFAPAVVGSLAGALLPSFASLVGGNIGGNLGSGMGFRASIKSIDWVAVAGQSIGSAVGSMLGSMIPIPFLGTMIGGIIGGIVGEKIFSKVAAWMGYKKKQAQTESLAMPSGTTINNNNLLVSSFVSANQGATSKTSMLLPEQLTQVAPSLNSSALQSYKETYETAYKSYVSAVNANNTSDAAEKLELFNKARADYEAALTAIGQ